MKEYILLAMGLCASVALSQSLPYVPSPRAMYISSDGTGNAGTWAPESGTGTSSLSSVPQPVGAYCSNDGSGNAGTWVPCAVSSGGGAVTSVFGRTGPVVATAGDYTAAKVTNALDLSNASTQTMSGNLALPVGASVSAPIIRSQEGTTAATLLAGRWTYGASGGLSLPTAIYTGAPIATGGTGTTTWPLVLLQPTGTTTTTWSTTGTFLGINAASAFTGNLFDFQLNGTSRASLSAGGTLNMLTANATNYHTATNCSSATSPAVCAAAASGSFVIAASGTAVTVNTTAITATSQIYVQQDNSLGTKLGVTCNTGILAGPPAITARTAGTSFAVGVTAGLATNPVCFSYTIIN